MAPVTDPVLTRLREYFRQQDTLRLVMVFGSVARQQQRFDSDIDIAILMAHELSMDEKKTFIEDVAVITGRAVDLVDLTTAGEPLLGQILEYGLVLLGESSVYASLLIRHFSEQLDFLPYRQRMLEQRRRAWIG